MSEILPIDIEAGPTLSDAFINAIDQRMDESSHVVDGFREFEQELYLDSRVGTGLIDLDWVDAVSITRPHPDHPQDAIDRWSTFGGHRLTFYGDRGDDNDSQLGTQVDFFVNDHQVSKRVIRPSAPERITSSLDAFVVDSLVSIISGLSSVYPGKATKEQSTWVH